MRVDFDLSGHGTVYLFQPLTASGSRLGRRPSADRRDGVRRRRCRWAQVHRPDFRRRDRRRARAGQSDRAI